MSYRPSFQRLIAIPVILLTLLGSGLALRALAQHTSSGAPATTAAGSQAGSGHTPVDVASTHGTYGLPPSQPHEFTLTSDGQ